MTADRRTLAPELGGATRPSGVAAGGERRGQSSRGATTGGARIVLATLDPVFAAQCHKALEGTDQQLLATVSLAELVDATRRLAPELVVLDADGEDVAALKMLATKVMLVSDARIVLVSAYLAPGSPLLCALLQSIAASFVQKSRGPSWLGLPEDDRASFVGALHAAVAADDGERVAEPPISGPAAAVVMDRDRHPAPRARDDVDVGWGADAARAAPPRSRP